MKFKKLAVALVAGHMGLAAIAAPAQAQTMGDLDNGVAIGAAISLILAGVLLSGGGSSTTTTGSSTSGALK